MNQFFPHLCSARGCSCGCGLVGFQGQSTVQRLVYVRMVVDTRARVGCLTMRRVEEKGLSLVIYFVLYFCRLGASQEQCRAFGLGGFQAGVISGRVLY